MPANVWGIRNPRKHANEKTRHVECEQCKQKLDREQHVTIKAPDGTCYCLGCAGEVIDDRIEAIEEDITELKSRIDTLKRIKTKVFVLCESG